VVDFDQPEVAARYLDTLFSDEWVHEHYGQVEHLWSDEGIASTMAAVP